METTSTELELFIQICFGVIVLCIIMIGLTAWKKRAAKKDEK
jgi:hypothetical protein